MEDIRKLLQLLKQKNVLDKQFLIQMLELGDPKPVFEAADAVREAYVGKEVHLRALVEFSNQCCRSCVYCGLRAESKDVSRYQMDPSEVVQVAKLAVDKGFKTIVLQSGEDRNNTVEEICNMVDQIKTMDVAVTLSIGEYPREAYKAMRAAGADRYLLRIETTNEELYQKLHPGMQFKERVRCLYDLKELGYEVGTGCLVGLPGQTVDMLAEDLLFFKELDAHMIGIGPLIPCPGTPLEGVEGGETGMVLKMMALTRLLLPDINIPVTTALAVKDREGYQKGLACGGNVMMPNLGKDEYKKNYRLYPGKEQLVREVDENIEAIKRIIAHAGRVVAKGQGGTKERRQ